MEMKFGKQLWIIIPFGTAIALGLFLAVASHALEWSQASTFVVGGALAAVLGLLGTPLVALLREGVPDRTASSQAELKKTPPPNRAFLAVVVDERGDQPHEEFLGWAKNENASSPAPVSEANDWANSSFKIFLQSTEVAANEPSTWEWGLLEVDREMEDKGQGQEIPLGHSLASQPKKLKVSLN